MNKLVSILSIVFTFFLLIMTVPKFINIVSACSASDPCPSGYQCIGLSPTNLTGTCEQVGCFSNVTCVSPQYCVGDVCLGGSGTQTPRPGGGECTPTVPRTDCPANSVRGTTVVSSVCGGNTCNGIGSAQAQGSCCRTYTEPRECTDWYNCGTRNNPDKMCRDCTDPQPECVSWNLVTYNCISTCTPVAASAPQQLSPTNGSTIATTTPNLTWSTTNMTWGTSCATNNRTFEVFIGTSAASMSSMGIVASTVGSVPFNGTAGLTYYWKVRASNGQGFTDSAPPWTFTINPGPWWQAKDADLTTNNGISSDVPTGQLFNSIGLGGFPGVVTYGTTFNLAGTTKISTTSWNANTTTIQPRLFNYQYFDNLIPESVRDNITIATDDSLRNSTGYKITGSEYEWFKSDGSLTIASDINFGTRKVILFVENGGLGINGRVNLSNTSAGTGFFGTFVEGNIVVDPAVTGAPSIEGIYLTDLGFSSGASTLPLHVRGSIVSHGGVTLSRDLTNNTNPAELFEFAPDQVLLFPDNLRYKRTKWAEIAP
ncbi:MAG: hypothetical protein WA152_03510 [Microgenomates group bacterium]